MDVHEPEGTTMYSASRKTSRKCRATVASFLRISAIKRRLPAAGLRARKIHLVAQPLQHLRHRDSDLWKHLIDDAGDE